MSELQISVEAGDGLERRMRVQVPAARIDDEVTMRLRKVGRSARIKGFRPGKAPAKVIRQRYGDQVRQEVLQEVLQSTYSEAVNQQQLRPVAGPRIEPEALEEGADLAYTAIFEVYPEVSLAPLDKLKVTQSSVSIGDEDVDAMLEKLRKQRATWTPVERKAAEKDQVRVDFAGTIKGEPLEGGQGEDVPIELGARQMLPDFEKNLRGLAAGEEKTFDVKFPKDYHAEELAGKKASFSVTVREVAESVLPDIDEEFIKSFGVDSGYKQDLMADIRRNMEREAGAKSRAEVKRQVMEGLLAANEIVVPDALVRQECNSLQQEAMRQMGVTEPADAPPLESFNETALQRVRLGILIGTVVAEEKLEVDRERVKLKVNEICAPYDQSEEVARMYFQNPQLLAQVENVVLEEQVVDLLLSKAKITDKNCSFDELMQA
ncbi:MAG: trigger factor [Gammaproteobacteria bacterium]|nr:trigger factor [Gammaproteobacteria bacterium]